MRQYSRHERHPDFFPIAQQLCQDPAFVAEVLAMLMAANEILGQLQAALPSRGPLPALVLAQVSPLTPQETRILREVSSGRTNAEIGARCGISGDTVKNHLTAILRKLAAQDRAHAVAIAMRRGWIPLDPSSEVRSQGDSP